MIVSAKYQPLDVLLQEDRQKLLEKCDTKDIQYKVYPTSADERVDIEMDRYPDSFQKVHNFWSFVECFTDSFRLDVTISYLVILLNTAIIWASAVFFVIASSELLEEASIIKWQGLSKGGPTSYQYGLQGMRNLALSFGLASLHMLIALISSLISHWENCPGMRIAWAEGTMLDVSRQTGYCLGYGVFGIGSFLGSAVIPHAGKTLETHPGMVILNGKAVDTNVWEGHYNTRLDGEMSVYIMLAGAALCALTVIIQMILGEGFNVCYIFPFARCNYEWHKLAVPCNKGDQDDVKSDLQDFQNIVPSGLPFTTLCLTNKRKNRCPWLATFAHNIFGALRTHYYVASAFILVGATLRFFSMVPPEAALKKDWPIYISWQNSSGHKQVYVKYTINATITYNVTEWNDASYYMWTSSLFFFSASIFTILGTIGYSIGLIITRASLPANHVVDPSMFVRWCWG
jgi:hypothetical protein